MTTIDEKIEKYLGEGLFSESVKTKDAKYAVSKIKDMINSAKNSKDIRQAYIKGMNYVKLNVKFQSDDYYKLRMEIMNTVTDREKELGLSPSVI